MESWFTHTVTAIAGAIATLSGAIFFVWKTRNQISSEAKQDSYVAQRKEDSDTVASWRELLNYKTEDFQKKNEAQDKRSELMLKRMDEMHVAHLKCERDALEREKLFFAEVSKLSVEINVLKQRLGVA